MSGASQSPEAGNGLSEERTPAAAAVQMSGADLDAPRHELALVDAIVRRSPPRLVCRVEGLFSQLWLRWPPARRR